MKILLIILLPAILTSCNSLGLGKAKSIVELTPKLLPVTNERIYLDSGHIAYQFDPMMLVKNTGYGITKDKMAAEPLVVGNVVYALDIGANISAFSLKSNKIVWSYNLARRKKDNYIGGGIAYHDGKLYITYGARFLVILDAKSGHELLRKELPDIIKIKPVITNDIILVQTVSNQVVALNSRTLVTMWQHEETPEVLVSSHPVLPVPNKDDVIVSYSSGRVTKLNAKNGNTAWSFIMSEIDQLTIPDFEEMSILCTPVSDRDNLYIASGLGKIIKLNSKTGDVIWNVDVEGIQSMVLIGNNLFITNNARQIASLDPESGKVKFVADLTNCRNKSKSSKSKASIFLTPFVGKKSGQNSLHIISTDGFLYSFALSNRGLSTIPTVTKIAKNVIHYGVGNGDNMYLFTDKKIIIKSRFTK